LVIDEILAVGDVNFQSKCQERLRQMKAGGTTMVIASHDMQQVLNLSDEVLVLEDGRLELHGDPDMAVRSFHELMQRRTENRKSVLAGLSKEREMPKQRGNRIGTLEASIDNVLLLNDEGRIISDMISGDGLTVELAYSLNGPVSDMNVLLGIYTDSNLKCFETHIDSTRSAFGQPAKRGCYRCRFQTIPLLPGHYFVNVGFYPLDWTYTYDYHWQQHDLFVHSSGDEADKTSTGIISLKPRWSFSEAYEKG
jgi:lipopolysaccharide transport system ATP-binding protein